MEKVYLLDEDDYKYIKGLLSMHEGFNDSKGGANLRGIIRLVAQRLEMEIPLHTREVCGE